VVRVHSRQRIPFAQPNKANVPEPAIFLRDASFGPEISHPHSPPEQVADELRPLLSMREAATQHWLAAPKA
jgi:hypothetical protein